MDKHIEVLKEMLEIEDLVSYKEALTEAIKTMEENKVLRKDLADSKGMWVDTTEVDKLKKEVEGLKSIKDKLTVENVNKIVKKLLDDGCPDSMVAKAVVQAVGGGDE